MSSLLTFWNIIKNNSYLKERLENRRKLLQDDLELYSRQKKIRKKKILKTKNKNNKPTSSNIHHTYQNSKIYFLNHPHHHHSYKMNNYISKNKNIDAAKLGKEEIEKESKIKKKIYKNEEKQLTTYKSFSTRPKNKNQIKKTKILTQKVIIINIILFLIKVNINEKKNFFPNL